MPLATNCNRIRHDVLRQCHAWYAGIADVMDICTSHLAHQRNLTNRGGIGTLLRGSDGCQRQLTVCVYSFNQAVGIVLCDARYSAGAGSRMISAPAAIKPRHRRGS